MKRKVTPSLVKTLFLAEGRGWRNPEQKSLWVNRFELDGLLRVGLLVLCVDLVIYDLLVFNLVAVVVEVCVSVVPVDSPHVLSHLVDSTQDPVADLASRQAFVN